jgi:hypothetical protein
MRYICAVLAMTLLASPIGARGEDAAQRVPADGQCPVPADPGWRPQEKFVWRQVCRGEVADFNSSSQYGGYLDPKRPEGLPESRTLGPSFLETILLSDKYRHALTRLGVRISGARFSETVNLENAELRHDLWLYQSLLEAGANFQGLKSTHLVLFDRSKVAGEVNLSDSKVDRLYMGRDAEFNEVDLKGAHIGGDLSLTASKVNGKLDMDHINVDGSLRMGAEFRKTKGGRVIWKQQSVDESLFIGDEAEFEGCS